MSPEHALAIYERSKDTCKVFVDPQGYSEIPRVAREQFGCEPELFLIRKDGWLIGCPRDLLTDLQRIWAGDWAYVINPTDPPVVIPAREFAWP